MFPPQITFLFNFIIQTLTIPNAWKCATVIPFLKQVAPISNSRPISLLPLVVKTFEKILHQSIFNFLENNVMCTEQGGFLPQLGTNDTIGKFLGDVYLNMNGGDPTLCVFFELKKAFDTIDHSMLLYKLQ